MAGQQGQPKYGFGWPDGRLGGLGPPGSTTPVYIYISMVTNQNRLSAYLGFLLYFHKSQSYTLCKYTWNFKMFKTYHSEVI